MSGASVTVEITGLERVQARISDLAQTDFGQLADEVGALVVSQTQRRIHSDKAAPDGRAWPEWSPRYARTRHANQSLLESDGYLLTSIQHVVEGSDVEVGSNMVYAASHQYGDPDRNIPQRQYLGLSDSDGSEVIEAIEGFFERLTRGER